ncbi:hypothetical protein M153_3800001036 [Pseudoloma neurophilia]|uniref:Uncharacterized protein n=1 Tax=Pseudoloma neurophilia TaxID=146866 RepID=A0A0R0M5C0_9MICR|nr:hypothetical protein M153_3800001036 [Pseudoloma neurophilia]
MVDWKFEIFFISYFLVLFFEYIKIKILNLFLFCSFNFILLNL